MRSETSMNIRSKIAIYRYSSIDDVKRVEVLANFLSDSGYLITLICAESGGKKPASYRNGVHFKGLGRSTNRMPHFIGKLINQITTGLMLRKELLQGDYDLIYVMDSWSLISFFVARAMSRKVKSAPTIYHTYDWLEPSLVPFFHRYMEKNICNIANLVVNVDASRAKMQQSIYGFTNEPYILPNFWLKNEVQPKPDPDFRRTITERDDAVILIYPSLVSGPPTRERQIYELIDAHSHLSDRHRLVIFYHEGEEYERCLELVKNKSLGDKVVFKRPVTYGVLLSWIAACDLGAILYDYSRSAGYYMCNADKLSIYLGCRLPYVATDVPNISSITYKYQMGTCCNSKDSESIANAIKELAEGKLSLDYRKERMSAASHDELFFEYKAEEFVNKIDAIMNRSADLNP